MRKILALVTSLLLLTLSTTSFAEKIRSVEFFASNNTATINLQTAYNRLHSNEQDKLQENVINIMQKYHLEQGKSVDILGTYQMSNDGKITADNTDAFITSPYQYIHAQTVFTIAKQLAYTMKQESVAVFIPSDQPVIGELKLSFTSHAPTIKEVVQLIHSKLPPSYGQAYSLHLTHHECSDFDHATVTDVEWLGSKINLNDVKNAFPTDKVSYQYGKAYLVYKTGQKEPL